MSLANLIMANNQQNANYGIQMANDLSAFGQTVVKGMKDKRDMGTAQSMLPVMQQAMKSFGEGKSAEGYSTLLTLSAADPSNPYLDKLIKVGLIGGQAVDDNRYKMAMAEAAKARVAAGTPSGPSGLERLRNSGLPAMIDSTDLATQQRQSDLEGEYLDKAKHMSDPDVQAEQDLKALPSSNGGDFTQASPEVPQDNKPKFINQEHKAFVPVILDFMEASPDEKQQVRASATTTKIQKGFEKRSYKGLNEIFPELTGDILIPEVGTVTRIRKTVSTSDAPDSEIKATFTEVDEKTGEERYKFNIETANRIPAAVKAMTNQAPVGQSETFADLFKKNGGVDNAVVSPLEYTPDTDMFQLTFKDNVKDTYNISKDQVEHLQVVQNIPAMAGSGYQFVASEKKKELSTADKVREQFRKSKDDSTKTPPPPERKSEKTKAIDEQLKVLKEKELVATAGKRKERIAQIDREIEQLARLLDRPATSTSMYPTRREETREKSQFELQESRKKILELEEEKEKLLKVK